MRLLRLGLGSINLNECPSALKGPQRPLQDIYKIDLLFGPEFVSSVFAYMDDLVIISEEFGAHLKLAEREREREF